MDLSQFDPLTAVLMATIGGLALYIRHLHGQFRSLQAQHTDEIRALTAKHAETLERLSNERNAETERYLERIMSLTEQRAAEREAFNQSMNGVEQAIRGLSEQISDTGELQGHVADALQKLQLEMMRQWAQKKGSDDG